jgi:hypothetical protein
LAGWHIDLQEVLSPEEAAQLIQTLFRQCPREVRFLGLPLGIDADAKDAVLRTRLEAFFQGVCFRPTPAE